MNIQTIARIALPVLDAKGLRWRTVSPGVVEIAVDLVNEGERRTEPDDLVIESARLGAFVPFKPVTRVAVGAMDPGERRTVTTTVPARDLGLDDLRVLLDLSRTGEWIGNLNVYFDSRPEGAVERHCAFDLCVRAGVPQSLMLMIMTQGDLTIVSRCSHPDWRAETKHYGSMSLLRVFPPEEVGSESEVVVEVTRHRDGKMVPVEFTFETVKRASDKLGCV